MRRHPPQERARHDYSRYPVVHSPGPRSRFFLLDAGPQQWFNKDAAFDAAFRERFEARA